MYAGDDMDLPDHLVVIHQPARLKMMALLYKRGDVGAAGAREALRMTAGNLESHGKRLSDAGLVAARKVLKPAGFESRYRITASGIAAFTEYLSWLEAFVQNQA